MIVKIKTKLTLVMLCIAGLIGIFGLAAIITAEATFTKNVGERSVYYTSSLIESISSDVSTRVGEFIAYEEDLTLRDAVIASNEEFASMSDIEVYIDARDAEWRSVPKEVITPFMQNLMNNRLSDELIRKISYYEKELGYRIYGEVFVTNKYGANIAETGKTSDYRQNDEAWWQNAAKDGVYIEKVQYDESADVYSTSVGIRINDYNGNFIGVMKVVININGVIDAINKANVKSASDVDLELLDQEGQVLYTTEDHPLFEKSPLLPYIERGIGYAITDGDQPGEGKLLVAYSHAENVRDANLNWTLTAEFKTDEVLAPVYALRNALIFLFISALGAALIGSIVLSESISKPLVSLKNAAVEISHGNLNKVLKAKSGDEIGQLAVAFNKMTESLKKSQGEVKKYSGTLEQKVKERTKELDTKLTELTDAKSALLNMMEDYETMNKKLEEDDVKKNEFTLIAAHELKTPLTSIHGFSQLLQKAEIAQDPEKRAKYLAIIEHETRRLAKVVNDVLDLSKIDLGTIKLEVEEIDVEKVMEGVRAEMDVQIKEKNLESAYIIEKRLPAIRTDREKFVQVLINLINNAVKYTPKGKITVKISKEGSSIHVMVKDTGIGISKENQSKIFTRFYQVDSSYTRSGGGVGLGLSLCKELIGKMGGRIWFVSEYGKGSEFHFTLPVTKAQES